METLKCSKCKEIKSTDLFGKHKNTKTGFQSMCKICTKGYNKQFYIENKERIDEHQKKYQEKNKEKNKEKIKEHNKRYRKENKEKIKQYQKENKEKLNEQVKQYHSNIREKLDPIYIKILLKNQGFKAEQITDELIQLKTITIKTQRLCNQLKN